MASINNHFTSIVTSPLMLLGFAFLIFFANSANAQDPIFTVENVKVDATAENAIAAREKAFEEAQIKAFQELTTRMLPEADIATTQPPATNIISTMIKDFELTNEQLSSVRYIGTYTFRFKDRDVRRYFAQKGATIIEASSKTLLILPFIDRDSRTSIWSPGNLWMQAWNRVPNLGGVVPLEVPLGDINDVRDISDSGAYTYDAARLNSMLQRYNANEAVVTVATPDEEFQKIIDPLAVAKGSLVIEIYRTDRGTPELVNQLTITADGALTRQQVYDRGVTMVRSALQKNWKAKTATPAAQKSKSIRVAVPIQNLNDWLNIQSQLKRISSLQDITLKSLSPRQANIEIYYKGDKERLNIALAQAGMEIERTTASDGSSMDVLVTSRPSNTKPMRF